MQWKILPKERSLQGLCVYIVICSHGHFPLFSPIKCSMYLWNQSKIILCSSAIIALATMCSGSGWFNIIQCYCLNHQPKESHIPFHMSIYCCHVFLKAYVGLCIRNQFSYDSAWLRLQSFLGIGNFLLKTDRVDVFANRCLASKFGHVQVYSPS